MRKFLLIIPFIVLCIKSNAQTFNGAGGTIPDNAATPTCFPLTVNGIGHISNSNLGVASVCINITHTWVADLEIYLKAPDGTTVPLSIQNGGSEDNYIGTCFSGTALTAVADATAPFTGTYIPDGYIGAVNNGQDADGLWQLCIQDVAPGQTGSLSGWSINFSTGLPPGPPVCNNNPAPGNTCAEAPFICSFYGFCSATSSRYTSDSWTEFDNTFCGTVQNNAFVKFVATRSYMDFNVWVTSSTNHDGIQIFFYDGGCGSGAITDHGCYSPIRPGASPVGITAAALTIGNTYYMMIDGFAGDECNYMIEPFYAVGGLTVSADSSAVCLGKSVLLTASGGNGTYSWTGAGLNAYTGNIVTATPVTTTTYSVSSIDPGGTCPVTKQIDIAVLSLPPAPTVPDTLSYCQETVAEPLTASGLNLLWYTAATGGIGTQQSIIPTTSGNGMDIYYVSQTIGCESPRSPIYVVIKNKPEPGQDKKDTICFGETADLTTAFDITGLNVSWAFNNIHISPPVSVSAGGTYMLSVTNNEGCADTGFVHLTVQPPVHVSAGNDTIAVKGLPHQLHSSPAATYSWSPAYLLNDPGIRNPQTILTHDQEFIVNVTDVAGCAGSDTVMVKIIQGITYYVPNAFTPNSDGLNDIFYAIPVGIARTEYFRVLNRFGKMIFETSDPFNKGWDGTYMGYKQPAGSYVWLLKGVDINGKLLEMKGTVVLIL